MIKLLGFWWADFLEDLANKRRDGTTEREIAYHKIRIWARDFRKELED